MTRRNPWRWYSDLEVGNKIAIVAIVVPLICTIVGAIYFQLTNESNLELVDTRLKKDGPATVVDIELRNTGRKVAYLEEADFEVEKTWELQSSVYPDYMRSSYNYDVLLTPTGAPYTKTRDLHQAVEPDKADRFTFTVGLDPPKSDPGNIQYVFLVSLDLIYDEDDKVVSTERLLFVRKPAWGPKRYFFPSAPPNSFSGRWHSHNQKVLDAIGAIGGIKSKDLKTLIRHAPQENQ